jgi:hypothetical protein
MGRRNNGTVNIMNDVVAVILLGLPALAASSSTIARADDTAFAASVSHHCDK